MKNLVILGSTGSIGTQTLQVVRAHRDRFVVKALAAGNNLALLAKQVQEFSPEYVCIKEAGRVPELTAALSGCPVKILSGDEGLSTIATLESAHIVLVAIVGVKALIPTLKAIRHGKHIALASKEILVAAGHLVMDLARKHQVMMLPVDSEHGAIFQCMQGNEARNVEKIILTASGGPFWGLTSDQLDGKTLRDALAHPNWAMGRKITIDSATLINKGLEVIEAHWLFNMPYDSIEVVIHRESIIHSIVTYCDGSMLAQLGAPDMCIPIQYALSYPQRLAASWPRADLVNLRQLTFYAPDLEVFSGLRLAYAAGRQGGSAPATFNAANEQAVGLFLEEKIRFVDIPRIVEDQLGAMEWLSNPSLDDIIQIDQLTRVRVKESYGR